MGLDGVRPHDLRHHAATIIARNPNVTLRELMATIGHSSHVAALRYQHATTERSKAIADYLDDVIKVARSPLKPAPVRGEPWHHGGMEWPAECVAKSESTVYLPRHLEAAPGFEPGYGALQAPA